MPFWCKTACLYVWKWLFSIEDSHLHTDTLKFRLCSLVSNNNHLAWHSVGGNLVSDVTRSWESTEDVLSRDRSWSPSSRNFRKECYLYILTNRLNNVILAWKFAPPCHERTNKIIFILYIYVFLHNISFHDISFWKKNENCWRIPVDVSMTCRSSEWRCCSWTLKVQTRLIKTEEYGSKKAFLTVFKLLHTERQG